MPVTEYIFVKLQTWIPTNLLDTDSTKDIFQWFLSNISEQILLNHLWIAPLELIVFW